MKDEDFRVYFVALEGIGVKPSAACAQFNPIGMCTMRNKCCSTFGTKRCAGTFGSLAQQAHARRVNDTAMLASQQHPVKKCRRGGKSATICTVSEKVVRATQGSPKAYNTGCNGFQAHCKVSRMAVCTVKLAQPNRLTRDVITWNSRSSYSHVDSSTFWRPLTSKTNYLLENISFS